MATITPKPIEPQIDEVLGFKLDESNYKQQLTPILNLFMLMTSPRQEYSYSARTIDLRYIISRELSRRRGQPETSLTAKHAS